MGMDNTVTEQDMDAASQQVIQGFRNNSDPEPDLTVDGLSESIVGKLLRILSSKRA